MVTNESASSVLIVEDDLKLERYLRSSLESLGYTIVEAMTGRDAVSRAAAHNPDLVILDLGLPDMDGVDVIRRLREWATMPILILSARGKELDKVGALDAGADDYLTKPFSFNELVARVRAAIRRSRNLKQPEAGPVLACGELVVDMAARTVKLGAHDIHLTPNEFTLLVALMKNAGRVVTQRQLLDEIWGLSGIDHGPSLRVHMHQLRQKIDSDIGRPRYIKTETGVGYRFSLE